VLPNAPDIATTQGQRGCGRCPGAFTVEATAAARHGNAPELWVVLAISDRALARLAVLGAAGRGWWCHPPDGAAPRPRRVPRLPARHCMIALA
jgi:hypothetical protein